MLDKVNTTNLYFSYQTGICKLRQNCRYKLGMKFASTNLPKKIHRQLISIANVCLQISYKCAELKSAFSRKSHHDFSF